MKIKKFFARNYREALDLVKKEFGNDAVILETSENKSSDRTVIVTAAIDIDKNEKIENKNSEIFKSVINEEINSIENQANLDNYLRKELSEIKSLLLAINQEKGNFNFSDNNYMKKIGIKEDFIESFKECLNSKVKLNEKISSDIKAGYRLSNGKSVMLVGPTGVGKTTTILKLASFAVKIGKKVGILNLDNYRLGASEQLRVFSQLLGISSITVCGLDEFYDVYKDFSKDKDMIFIDTTGRNPKDVHYIETLSKIRGMGYDIDVHLTVSLSMQEEIFFKSKDNYEKLGIDFIILTKLDEAYRLGSIYNICKTYNKPVSYLTNGQRIPNDIQPVSPIKLANIILDRGVIQ